jgi:hypothetical protein
MDADGDRVAGLNSLEVTFALLHAFSFAALSTVAVFDAFPRRAFTAVPFLIASPPAAVLGTAFLGWAVFLLARASRRPPRHKLGARERVVLVLSGLVGGLVGLPLVVVAFVGRW